MTLEVRCKSVPVPKAAAKKPARAAKAKAAPKAEPVVPKAKRGKKK